MSARRESKAKLAHRLYRQAQEAAAGNGTEPNWNAGSDDNVTQSEADPTSDYCKPGDRLSPHHLKLIIDSGISAEVARERGYRTVDKKVELKNAGFTAGQQLPPTLLIPLHDTAGRQRGYQHRPDSPRLDRDRKPIKYEMPKRARLLLDVHPRLTRVGQGDAAVPPIKNPACPLIITEGIRKADSAVSINLCAIGLNGVFGWRGRNSADGLCALPDWDDIPFNGPDRCSPEGRLFLLAFDSDVMIKIPVYLALARFRKFLEHRGARVKVIYLPPGPHGEKVGLDDWIAARKLAEKDGEAIKTGLLALAVAELRRHASVDDGRGDNTGTQDKTRSRIAIKPGRHPMMVDRAEQVLVRNAEALRLFQRTDSVVRVISLSQEDAARAKKRDGLERPEGAVVLYPVSATALLEILDRQIEWIATNADGEERIKDCPAKVAATYLSRVGFWKLPSLTGVIEAPTLRPDGTVLDVAGYDRATGLFLNCGDGWPTIPQNPSRADAEAALKVLMEPFSQFPFVGQEHRSVFLAGILTALLRRLLESAPLFGFSAPAQRSGKSLLVESIGIIATGRISPAAGVSRESEELRKAITSTLREGHLIAHLDNIIYPLDSPDLARAITQGIYGDRLLSTNTNLRLPTNVMWTATGNNLTFRGDVPSRALLCRIDANLEHPEERTFQIEDLHGHLQASRKQLVAAALTILRAYRVAGCPRQDVRPWGGFNHWSREIREPLLWLDLVDPCASREQIVVNDPDRELAADVLHCWTEAFGERARLVREVIAASRDHDQLRKALLMVSAQRDDPEKIDPRRLGNWFAGLDGRVIDGMRLIRDCKIQRATAWRVSYVSYVSPKPVDPEENTLRPESKNAEIESDRPEFDSHNSLNSPPPVQPALLEYLPAAKSSDAENPTSTSGGSTDTNDKTSRTEGKKRGW